MAERTRFYYFCSQEQFPPSELLQHAIEAERAGFDGIASSDHLQPWWEPGESGHTWIWLGAAAQATDRVPIGTGVTPPGPRYHPVLIAQAWATLEQMYPGRTFLGFGSGESLNESPLGEPWPSVPNQVERMEEALELIHRLFEGERVTHEGEHFRTDQAILHTLPERRPPIYVSAFGPRAAGVAARWGDGVWTLGHLAGDVLDAYRSACDDAGRPAGEILLQTGFSWAPDEEQALEAVRGWKGAQPQEFYRDDWHDPRDMYAKGEREVSDEELASSFCISTDPEVHADRLRELEKLGATIIVLANNSGADPLGGLRFYADKVLPGVRPGVR